MPTDDDGPASANAVKSVPGAIPNRLVRACQVGGCDRPVARRRRKYCSRHRCLADVDYVRDLYQGPDSSAAQTAAQHMSDLERTATPLRRMEAVLRDAEKATRTLKSFLSGLPAPSPLSSFQREARSAWESFHGGDPEPLDAFVRRHLLRLKNTHGPVPDRLRRGVMDLLDSCFERVPFYSPGDWFLYTQSVWDALSDLVGANLKMNGNLRHAISGDDQSLGASLRDKRSGAIGLAWGEVQWDEAGSRTLLNHVEGHLKTEGHEAPKLLAHAERKPGAFVGDDVDDSLAEFGAREAARQRVEVLPRLIEKASFSKYESVVYGYDSRVGTELDSIEEATQAAAQRLEISYGNVRTYRFRYRDKLRKAAER